MDTNELLKPLKLKSMDLKNRIFMAPMTRLRTLADLSMPLMAETYYAQRASAGLIISETLAVVPYGQVYGAMPEFISTAQIASWKNIVEAVHAAGGRIVAQLWHVGRPRSAEHFAGDNSLYAAVINPLVPDELTIEELEKIPKDFALAARNAIEIGFDAVEIHAGNKQLLVNFLREDANQRTDQYGGSPGNRAKLLLSVLQEVINSIGSNRVGLKVAPNSVYDGKFDSTARETFAHLLPKLTELELAYLQVNRAADSDISADAGEPISIDWIREHYLGTLVGAESFTLEEGINAVSNDTLDAVAFGRPFIANPDLPARFAESAPLNEPRRETFYTNEENGYLDYPMLANGTYVK